MSKNAKTVQEELELRRENKQDIHKWIREQSGQPADIHEFIDQQKKAEKTETEKNKNEKIN